MRAPGGRPLSRRTAGQSPNWRRDRTRPQHRPTHDRPATCLGEGLGEAPCRPGTHGGSQHPDRQRRRVVQVGTWNVTSLFGKEKELVEEAIRYRLEIVGVSSTKRKGNGQLVLDHGWQFFHAGVDPELRAQAGVGILTSPRLAEGVLEWKPVSERVALLRLRLREKPLALVQVYAPNTEPEYAAFLDEVQRTLQSVPRTEPVLLMGDLNAHVGSDADAWKGVIGSNGDRDLNAQGRHLLDFCASNGLAIMNTFFQHRDVHRYTWHRPGDPGRQRSLIDFIIASDDLRPAVLDVRVKRGAELSTDHHLVVCSLRLALQQRRPRPSRPKKLVRIKWEALADRGTRLRFAEDLADRSFQVPAEEADVETEWLLFRTAVLGAATVACGVKRVGADSARRTTAWWTDTVRVAVAEKKAAYRSWLERQDADSRQRYVALRDSAKRVVAEAKASSWEAFGRKLEDDHQSANKVFWQTIRRLRKGRAPATRSIKDARGRLLTSEGEVLLRWREHFQDLYNPSDGRHGAPGPRPGAEDIDHGALNEPTLAEVQWAVRALKPGKAAGIDEIRPEMLKAMGATGMVWLTRVCRVAWRSGRAPADWRTGVVVPIFKKGDQKDCSNYRGISLLSLPGKVYARVLERRCRLIAEPQIQEEQCGFRAGRGTTDQLFTLHQVFEKFWEYNRPVFAAFVDLEKAYDRVPRDLLWRTLHEYGIEGRLLGAIQSLYEDCRSCVRINGAKSDWFRVDVGLRQGCVLSPLLFIVFMDRIARRSATAEQVSVGGVGVGSLLFADDLAQLAPSAAGLQRALDRFAAECSASGMRINTEKTEVMHLSRQPARCTLHVSGVPLRQVEKFKYLGVEFASDGRLDDELDRRIGAAGAVLRTLYRTVVTKSELSLRTKLAIFRSVYRPTLTYGHELWVMTERIRSRVEAAEMRFLRRAAGLTLWDRVPSSTIRANLHVEPLLLWLERSQLRWLGHVLRQPQERLVQRVFHAQPVGKRPVGRPRMSWRKYIARLCQERLGLPWAEVPPAAEDRRRWRELLNRPIPQPSRTRGP
jgi:exonuclease III